MFWSSKIWFTHSMSLYSLKGPFYRFLLECFLQSPWAFEYVPHIKCGSGPSMYSFKKVQKFFPIFFEELRPGLFSRPWKNCKDLVKLNTVEVPLCWHFTVCCNFFSLKSLKNPPHRSMCWHFFGLLKNQHKGVWTVDAIVIDIHLNFVQKIADFLPKL